MTRLSLALAILAAALAAQLARDLTRPPPEMPDMASATPKPLPPPPLLDTPPVEQFTAMVSRPLFAASRRPVAGKPAAATLRLPEARLVGVLLSGTLRQALLKIDAAKPPRRLTEGQELDGWTIAVIEPRRVLLRQGELEHELALVKPKRRN